MRLARIVTAHLLALLLTLGGARAAAAPAAGVPFVGCASDGQTGEVAAPRRSEVDHVPAAARDGLAYYATRSLGTLAPAGWNCFAAYGSNGQRLIVAPVPLDFEAITRSGKALAGPAVEIAEEHGFTSGRYAVAAMIDRFFPAHRRFARGVEDMETPLTPLPAWPNERIDKMGRDALAFRTPAGQEGLGTMNTLAPGADPILGLVILMPDADMSMRTLSVRLGAGDAVLARPVLAAAAAKRDLALPRAFPTVRPRP